MCGYDEVLRALYLNRRKRECVFGNLLLVMNACMTLEATVPVEPPVHPPA